MEKPELTEEAKKGMINHAVKPNYYALCICVLTERIPEEAFRSMGFVDKSMKFSETDIDEILKLKKVLTWKQIGDRYGLSGHAIQKRVVRYMGQDN